MPLAATLPGPNLPVRLQEFPKPDLEPGAILLDTLYSEVCGTDVHLQDGRLAGVPYPIIPGHVSVGRVAARNGVVHDVEGHPIQIGDTVTFLDVHETCNHCWYCLVAHQTTRCPARKVYGITYSARDGLLGGWSQQVYLKPGVKIIRLPDQVSPLQVMAGGCALPTSLHALDRAQIRLGDTVAVQGAGPVGLTCAALAKLSGAGLVLIIDSRENRLKMAREIGIDIAVPLDPDDPDNVVRQVEGNNHGRGADVTIEATGAPRAVPDGMRMTRDGGRYVIVGHYTDGGVVALNPHTDINRKHLEVRGSWGSDFSHFHRMIAVLARFTLPSGLPWDHLVSATYGLHQMDEALASVRRGDVVKAIVDPWLRET